MSKPQGFNRMLTHFRTTLAHLLLGLGVLMAPTSWASTPNAAIPTATPENPYGLGALWAQGDAVAKITLLILVIMSMGSWFVIVTKYLEQSKLLKLAAASQDSLRQASSVRQAADALDATSPFRFIAEKGLEGAAQHPGLHNTVDFNAWVVMSLQRAMSTVQSRLQDGLAVLATVGSTAPFVGLFGTVWGIYHALVKIAIGLAVAVPAVLGYNWLVRRNKAVMEEVNAFGADVHAALLASAQR
jgi:biopolymer transport protein ExbB